MSTACCKCISQVIRIAYTVFFFAICAIHFGPFTTRLAFCESDQGQCIASKEVCGNGIDEDCSGTDLVCPKCHQDAVPNSGCNCGSQTRYFGFCCGDTWQTTPCKGEVFYLDVNGNDSNDGSEFKPWKTLKHAIKKVKAGDTVLINPGKYSSKEKISIRTSGEKGNPIVFRGNGKGAVIDLSECPQPNGFEIYFANHIMVENLTIHAPKNKNSRGIRLTHSTGSIINNNTVYGAGHANIFCSLSNYTVFKNNEAYEGRIGIYVSDSSDYVIVSGNLLHNNSQIGLHMNGDISSGNDGTISYAIVENNIIYGNNATGINVDGVTKSIFRNNLVYNNSKRGIAFFKDCGAVPSNDNYIIHNTIIMPGGAYYAIGLNSGAYRNRFYNNIIITEGNVPCFSTTASNNDLKILSDYNVLSNHGKIGEIKDRRISLRKWRGLGYDKHSMQGSISRTFVDSKVHSYHLKPEGPAIDAGTPSHSFGKDLLGNMRPWGTRPDMGAFEFTVIKRYKFEKEKGNVGDHPSSSNLNPNVEAKSLLGIKEDSSNAKIKRRIRNKLGMALVFIPDGGSKGRFQPHESRDGNEKPKIERILTKGFYMQSTEVTQRQWIELMHSNPSFFKRCGDNCPVEQVSWDDAQEFIQRLNRLEGGGKYRLPTEREWEHACRAGTTSLFFVGKCLSSERANYCGKFPEEGCSKGKCRNQTIPVGTFSPNQWGLMDMHGNVWEWCQDRFEGEPKGKGRKQTGNNDVTKRIFKGGGWNSHARTCRSGNSSCAKSDARFANLGFRVVRDP